jgi:hypothetical protein
MVPAAKPIVVSHHLEVEHVGHTKKALQTLGLQGFRFSETVKVRFA